MKIFKSAQVREADTYTIKYEPILSVNLMERASLKCAKKIQKLYNSNKQIVIVTGAGNNGGDGLAIARILSKKGYKVKVYILSFTENFSTDFDENYKRLISQTKIKPIFVREIQDLPKISKKALIIDAIFGSGLSRPINKGFLKNVIEKINKSKNDVLAIDIPSGLFGEENTASEQIIIKAEHTLTFEFPFLSFFFPENEKFVGKLHNIPIGIHKDYIKNTKSDYFLLNKKFVKAKIKTRTKFSHKGTYGHALIIAGSYGKAGAQILSAKATHRAGAGLVTAVVPKCNYQIMQIASPETILHITNDDKIISELPELTPYNSVAIGMGLGTGEKSVNLLKLLFENYTKPIVIDADAITILSKNKELLEKMPKDSILTPHPKEFERLIGKSKNNFERNIQQINFAKKYQVYLILKGANTIIATPKGKCYINSTGNSGMATAGSGDVLSGIIAGLKAMNYSSLDASILGVYFQGKAGDEASKIKGKNALIANDIIDFLKIEK